MKTAVVIAVIFDVTVLALTVRGRGQRFFWLRLTCAGGILFSLPGLLS